MDKIMKNKRDLELVTSHSPHYKTSYKKSFISDDVIKSVFELFQKLHLLIYYNPIHEIINHYSEKCGKGKNHKILNNLRTKSFLDVECIFQILKS